MKKIDVSLFVEEDGKLRLQHNQTDQHIIFRNANVRGFLINQEIELLTKLRDSGITANDTDPEGTI